MKKLSVDYKENLSILERELRVKDSFDVLCKKILIGKQEAAIYFIDGFIKDTVMQKLMMHMMSAKSVGNSAKEFMRVSIPYVETDVTDDLDLMIQMVMSGAAVMIADGFCDEAVIIDARTYPARQTEEPEGDRVMRGSRDGFVETLIFNTALVRRRIRNPSLTMEYYTVGSDSRTDVVLSFMSDRVDMKYVDFLRKKLNSLKCESLTMGHESLVELLIPNKWYNPFPKVRTTERPDSAASQLLEGSVLILIDNSPQVLVLPSTIFDFMQESNDFYFPPLTGTYIKLVRYTVFFLTLVLIPLWYLGTLYPELVPTWLSFSLPEETGKLPLIAQLFLAEFIIDALRLASLNTPNMLNNSLSVVGGLILGDFAVDIGWLIPEVILYMAFVAIANFTQRSYELGYAIKFLRLLLIALTALFRAWGFIGGLVLCTVLLLGNSTLNGKRNYVYPLIPFNFKALKSLVVRTKKKM